MRIEISVKQQTLTLFNNIDEVIASYFISTAANGVGCQKNSGCTPLGNHIIRAKIGADAAPNTVFVGRRATGEICTPALMAQFPNRDWILTRILWLDGLEAGKNRYGNVHTGSRYIYIHGCPDNLLAGQPESHGCIRMKNGDILDLFNRIPIGTKVFID